ncbi:Phosphate transport system permease protein pstA [Leclercia adecarboxylata]|uniref:Phosphate transport system permease protein pstA n=1 Tax=Leclercia adecarboxylata TaxID=83655 RepID=A0A4U9J4T6_9ENTR|nr:Phosphate transport system permease protein pstA [Leclercia adecarboxylata]
MQNTVELAESRRKMQARRRMKNRIALTLSMATMAFGLFWLIWILFSTVTRGIDGMSLALFTEMTHHRTRRAAVWQTPWRAAAC